MHAVSMPVDLCSAYVVWKDILHHAHKWVRALHIGLSSFTQFFVYVIQARKQPATCSPLQSCSCILIRTSLKGECFLLPVVMIVMVLSNFFLVYRFQSEVDEVLGNKESVSAEDLEKLQYTEQVCVLTATHLVHVVHPLPIIIELQVVT